MGMAILVTAISIYVIGIFKSDSSIFSVLAADFETTGFMNMPKAILNAFTYAGFQCVTLPTMIACGTTCLLYTSSSPLTTRGRTW